MQRTLGSGFGRGPGFFFMVMGALSGTIPGQILGDAVPLAHEDAPRYRQREPGQKGHQVWRRGVQKRKKKEAKAEAELMKECMIQAHLLQAGGIVGQVCRVPGITGADIWH